MPQLSPTDLVILALYFLLTLVVGVVMTRKASRNLDEYFWVAAHFRGTCSASRA